MKRGALALCAMLTAAPAVADDAAPVGWVVTREAFRPVALARSFQNDKLRDALEYGETEAVRAFDLDLNGDGKPERFVLAAEKLCGTGGCPYALLDGKTGAEIGGFFGSLIVLDRRENGWAVIQTLGKNEEGMSSLTTYSFQRVQYQPDDATLIDAADLDQLLRTLGRKP